MSHNSLVVSFFIFLEGFSSWRQELWFIPLLLSFCLSLIIPMLLGSLISGWSFLILSPFLLELSQLFSLWGPLRDRFWWASESYVILGIGVQEPVSQILCMRQVPCSLYYLSSPLFLCLFFLQSIARLSHHFEILNWDVVCAGGSFQDFCLYPQLWQVNSPSAFYPVLQLLPG